MVELRLPKNSRISSDGVVWDKKKNSAKNKSYCVDKNTKGAKEAILNYKIIKELIYLSIEPYTESCCTQVCYSDGTEDRTRYSSVDP